MVSDNGRDIRDDALWEFALRSYRGPGVAELALMLQNIYGVNVPVLLFAGWVAAEGGRELSDQDIADVAAVVEPWNDRIVRPLREVRTQLKSGPAPAPSEHTAILRDQVKAVELLAERIEIGALEQLGLSRFGVGLERSALEMVRANVRKVVEHYSERPVDTALLSRLSALEEALVHSARV